jgi:hypothetical protein
VRPVCLQSDDNILHGRKRHNGTFGMGGNGTRPSRTKTVQGNVQHGTKLQEEAFGMAKNCKKARSASEEIAQRNVYHGRKCHNE